MKNFISIIFLLLCSYGNAQLRISFATDVSVMRNFSPRHQFWAIGQNLHANLHFTKKESIYTSVVYYSSGKFRNRFVATAKSPSTIPSSIAYDIKGSLRSNEFSIGLKHFWLGAYDNDNNFNIYSITGFGIMFGRIDNSYSAAIDTSLYDNSAAPLSGEGNFRRLTLDLGLGVEYHVGGTIYAYSDLRTWLPTTNYPSEYLHSNDKVPMPLILSFGLRILFSYDY